MRIIITLMDGDDKVGNDKVLSMKRVYRIIGVSEQNKTKESFDYRMFYDDNNM